MKEINFDLEQLTEVEEYKCIILLYEEAIDFLLSHKWCKKVIKGWHDRDLSIYEKLGVFLFEVESENKLTDSFVWVIVGDIPTAYIDQSVTVSKDALNIYCDLMIEWSDNILQGKSLEECYPVKVEPTPENAQLLKSRIAFIKKEILLENT